MKLSQICTIYAFLFLLCLFLSLLFVVERRAQAAEVAVHEIVATAMPMRPWPMPGTVMPAGGRAESPRELQRGLARVYQALLNLAEQLARLLFPVKSDSEGYFARGWNFGKDSFKGALPKAGFPKSGSYSGR